MCDFSTIFGWLFDVLQVAINLADVATDYAILHQWFSEGETWAFGILLTIVLLSGIISAGALVIRLEDHLCCGRPGEWYEYFGYTCLFLPVSPLAGLINFVASHVWNDLDDFGDKETDWQGASPTLNKKDEDDGAAADDKQEPAGDKEKTKKKKATALGAREDQQQQGAAAIELAQDLEGSFRALKELDQAVLKRLGAYLLLGLSAASESIPSAVVQLIYISIKGGDISTLSLVSLLLSLSSIAFKSFLVARSFERKAVIAKCACIFFDVFALAYLFSSLFNAADPKDLDLLGIVGVGVTHLTYAYIIVKILSVSFCLISFFVLLVRVVQDSDGCEEWCGRPFVMFLALLVCGLPAMVVQETLKLSWFIMMVSSVEPAFTSFPYAGYVHQFLHSGSSTTRRAATDWRATLLQVLEKMETATAKVDKYLKDMVGKQKSGDDDDDEKGKKKADGNGNNDDDDVGPLRMRTAALRQRRGGGKNPRGRGPWSVPHAHTGGESFDHVPPWLLAYITAGIASTWQRALPMYQQPLAGEAIFHEDNFITRATHLECLSEFQQATNSLSSLRASLLLPFRRAADTPQAQLAIWNSTVKQRMDNMLRTLRVKVHTNEFLPPNAPNRLTMRDVMHENWGVFSWEAFGEACAKFWCCECTMNGGEIAEFTAAALVATSCVLSSLMGVIFPIAHASLYFYQQTLVGRISFIACMSALLVIILLLPSISRYIRTCRLINAGSGASVFLNNNILTAIDGYFSLPMLLVAKAVPSESLPEDCLTAHVLPFLDSHAVGLWGLGAADFDKMMAVWKDSAPARFDDVDEGDAAFVVAAQDGEAPASVADNGGGVVPVPSGDEVCELQYTASR